MRTMLVGILVALLPLAAQAQTMVQHRHNTTCFGGRCAPQTPVPSAPQYIPFQGPSVDLGRLEATTQGIKDEQRYQTHLMYLMLAQMQRSADLQLIGVLRPVNSGASQGGLSLPDPTTVPRAGPLPDPTTVPRAGPLPNPVQVQPAPPLPDPVGVAPAPSLPGPSGVPPAGSINPTRHKAWPQVARKK